MALAVATSPAHIDGGSLSSSITAAAVDVPAGALLVACVPANSSTGGTTTATVTDTAGLTWTSRIVANFATVAASGYAAIFTAPCPAGATGVAVTVTTAGSTATTRRPSLDVFVVTGADLSDPIASSAAATSTTNAPSFSPTSTVANSISIVCCSEWQKRGVPGAGTGFTATRLFDQPNGGTPSVRSRTSGANNTASTTHTISLPGTIVAGDRLVVEFAHDLATATSSTTSPGWTRLIQQAQGATTNHTAAVYTKVATGTDTLVIDTTASVCSTWTAHSVQNGGVPLVTQNNGGAATTATPVASTAGASGNWLGILSVHTDSSSTQSQTASLATGYGNLQSQNPNSGNTQSAASFSMERSYTGVTTHTPGTVTLGASEQWIAFTIAIPGQGADGISGVSNYAQWGAVGSQSYSLDAAGTSAAAWNIARVEIRPAAAASAPTVGAGADVADHPISTVLNRTATESDNGDAITARAWTIVSGPAGVGSTLDSDASLSWTPTTAGTYVLRYSATNGIGTGTDDVSVEVVEAPTVSAGADASVSFGSAFNRTATDTSDGGASISARSWTVVSGPADVGATLDSDATLSWTATAAGVYVLRYSATNVAGTGTDDVQVTVNALAPTVSAGADASVSFGSAFNRTATESANGASITARAWTIVSGPTGAGSTLDSDAALAWTATVAGAYVLRYSATNSVGTTTDDVAVTVNALAPTVSAGADDTSHDANTELARTATESANGATITARQWTIVSGPLGAGSVIGTAAALSWTPTTPGAYVLRYSATNSVGTTTDDVAVTVVAVSGVPFLVEQLGEDARLAVEVAFGADLTDIEGAGWTWTDITHDVRVADGISLQHGRSDEASTATPATCKMTLSNASGNYSLGGRSVYYPHVRQGAPVRVKVDLGDGGGYSTLFQGSADGWSPGWNSIGGNATVSLSASGVLRRMAQGAQLVQSTMRRSLSAAAQVVAYWPCEDLEDAQEIASGLPSGLPMTFSGRLHPGGNPDLPANPPDLASSSIFDSSLPLLKLNGAELYGPVPEYTDTGEVQVRFLYDIPAEGATDETVLMGMLTTGTSTLWEIRYKTGFGGVLNFRAWGLVGDLLLDQDVDFNITGTTGQMGLTLRQVGGDVAWDCDVLQLGATNSGGFGGTVTGRTFGTVTRVQMNTDGGNDEVTIGHIALLNDDTSQFAFDDQMNAYTGEFATTGSGRFERLAEENGLALELYGSGETVNGVADRMGPQLPATLLDLLRDCEAVDRGVLYDGIGPGLAYVTKRRRESRGPLLTLDAAAGEVGVPFVGVHDDQNRRNVVTASRQDGASWTHEDIDGPLGTATIGRYEDSVTIPAQKDQALPYYAAWLVHQGTVEGYRWSSLVLDLAAAPALAGSWVGVMVGDRIDVENVHTIAPTAPDETLQLAVEGYQQTLTPHSWVARVNTSPYRVWAIARAAATTGDTDEHVARADTDGAEVTAPSSAGATSLQVTTPSGPLWTTNSDDYPLSLDVGGVEVVATACSGTSSPQTFTVQPLPVARAAGLPVSVWYPPALGL